MALLFFGCGRCCHLHFFSLSGSHPQHDMRTNNGTHTIHKKRNEITLKVSLISFNSILITCGACHFTLKLNVTHFVFSSALLLLENFRAETSSVHISRGALTIPFQRLLFIDVYIMNFSLGCQLCAAQITLIYIHTNSCCFFSFLPFAHRFVYHFFSSSSSSHAF